MHSPWPTYVVRDMVTRPVPVRPITGAAPPAPTAPTETDLKIARAVLAAVPASRAKGDS